MLVKLVEVGVEAQERKQREFFDLARRFVVTSPLSSATNGAALRVDGEVVRSIL
jgi:hypothetical protein